MAGIPRRVYPPQEKSLEQIAARLDEISQYLEIIAQKINPDAFTEEDNQ
jgi:hypothetical protein